MRDLDACIRHVVLSVLATTACHHSAEAPTVVTLQPLPSASASARTVVTPPVATATAHRPRTAEDVCRLYSEKARRTADPRTETPARTIQLHHFGPGGSDADFFSSDVYAQRLGPARLQCRFVWGHDTVPRQVTIVSSCCPPHPRPCPPPTTTTMTARRAKVETVVLDVSTKTIERELEWIVEDPTPPRHYCGRRPEGMASGDEEAGTEALLAGMAEMEAASVVAFDRLARELAAHGAPPELVGRAREARADEIRHARALGRLARRSGRAPSRRAPARLPVRDLRAVAFENVVEGCVYETFGAALATFQAHRARDPEVRAALRVIAADERRHACLARDVHDWIARRLSPDDREQLDGARARAIESLAGREAVADEVLGLPTADEARALLAIFA